MSPEAQRIFSHCRKAMFCSKDIQAFVFLTIPWFTKSAATWWVLVKQTGCIFEYASFVFLIFTYWSMADNFILLTTQ